MKNMRFTRIEILEKLNEIKAGNPKPWVTMGEILLAVERYEIWREDGTESFTQWVRNFSKTVKKTESLLWRWLMAAKYYDSVIKYMLIDAPELQYIPKHVSSENLEALSKLEGQIPENLFLDIVKGIMAGTINRAELRAIHVALRDSHDAPELLYLKIRFFHALMKKTKKKDCGDFHKLEKIDNFFPFKYDARIILDIFLDIPYTEIKVDCVVIFYDKYSEQFVLNAIKVINPYEELPKNELYNLSSICEFVWIFVENICFSDLELQNLGILRLDDKDNIVTLRCACRNDRRDRPHYELRNEFLKKILLKVL
jgi:hypothetical protein